MHYAAMRSLGVCAGQFCGNVGQQDDRSVGRSVGLRWQAFAAIATITALECVS